MSDYVVIFCYENTHDFEDNLIATRVLRGTSDKDALIASGLLAEATQGMEVGARVRFEVYGVVYLGTLPESEVKSKISEDLVEMLDNNEVVYITDYNIQSKVGTGGFEILEE